MEIKVISGKEKEAWNEWIEKVPGHGTFYTWEYTTLNARTAKAEAELFVYEKEGIIVVYPYLKNPISRITGNYKRGKNDDWYDITTLDYGGPQENKEGYENDFQEEFRRYCKENRIVTEFARLHPFYGGHHYKNEAQYKKNVYYINLKDQIEDIYKNLKKSNRNSITKAKKEGIGIIRTTNLSDIKNFYEMYKRTMEKKRASDFYYYSEKYFTSLIGMLPKNVQLFLAYKNKEPIAGALFMSEKDIIHYYLSGRDIKNTINGVMNLLIWEAIQWAKIEGYSIFNLGGGYEPNDSLARFKSSFTKMFTSFKRYTYIHNKDKYEELKEWWKEHKKNGTESEEYFPVYRR